MASVNIEFSAFCDPRFKYLAKLSGKSAFDAIGRMAALWQVCVERNTSVLGVEFVDALVEIEGYASLIVQAELAEDMEGGAKVRIKGTDGRIEWLAKAREKQRKATAAAQAKRDRGRKSKQGSLQGTLGGALAGSSSASASASFPTSKKKNLVAPSETTRLWNSYAQQLKATKGIDAVHEGGKTGRHCKTLVNAHGIETAEKMVSVFLKDTDPWIADKAWSLGALVSQQQKYLAKTNSVRPRPVLNFGEDEE